VKCAHPNCNRGIGLVSHRRAFAKARFCCKQCRDTYVTADAKPAAGERTATTYFEWLFLPPSAEALPQMARSAVRTRQR
jgi:transposase-like protein